MIILQAFKYLREGLITAVILLSFPTFVFAEPTFQWLDDWDVRFVEDSPEYKGGYTTMKAFGTSANNGQITNVGDDRALLRSYAKVQSVWGESSRAKDRKIIAKRSFRLPDVSNVWKVDLKGQLEGVLTSSGEVLHPFARIWYDAQIRNSEGIITHTFNGYQEAKDKTKLVAGQSTLDSQMLPHGDYEVTASLMTQAGVDGTVPFISQGATADFYNRAGEGLYKDIKPGPKGWWVTISAAVPYFSNVTSEVGLDAISGFRISIADVNGDGYPDLLLHQIPQEVRGDVPCKKDDPKDPYTCKDQVLYLNAQGDNPNDPHSRKFIDYTEESGIRASRRGMNDRRSNIAIFADVDNDGDLDMFSGIYGHRLDQYNDNGDRNDLFLNDGSGHFTIAPNSPFHQEEFWNTTSATFLDYDRDGNIDLFIGNGYLGKFVEDKLYRGNGDGSFTNVTTSSGITVQQPTYAVTAADTNNDGFMDLFSSNYCQGPSIHWQNNGNGTFSQVQASTNYGQFVGPPFGARWTCSFGSMPRDFDNDGDIDFFELLVHGRESTEHSTVLVNDNNVFEWAFNKINRPNDPDPTHHRDHYGSWFDIDNDGLADFVLSQTGSAESFSGRDDHLDLFKQSESHTFALVTVESGLDTINTSDLPPHNATPFDYDLDGDEDLLIGFDGKEHGIQLWRNNVGTQNNWLAITLQGGGIPQHSNKSAIGARVEVIAGGQTYTREVYAGNGHFGPQAPLSLTFGIGRATKVDTIEVYWPNENHTLDEISNVAVNQFIHIYEIGDLDVDFDVDFDDLRIVTGCFGQDPNVCDPRADVNGDGSVNILDVSLVVSNFT